MDPTTHPPGSGARDGEPGLESSLPAAAQRAARRWPRAALTLLAALLLAACEQAPAPLLRVGINNWPGYDPLELARQLGYLDPSQVRLVEYGAATRSMRALANGTIEAAGLTLDEVLQLAAQGKEMRVVAVLDMSNGADALLASRGIAKAEDLRGKRVGAETTAAGGFFLARALEHLGLTRQDVQLVQLEYNLHEEAFRKEIVDAVVTYEPVRSRLLNAGARVLFDSSGIPGEIVDVLAVDADYLARNPTQVAHLLQAWSRAQEFMARQPQQAAARLAPARGLAPADYLASLSGLDLPGVTGSRRLLEGRPAPLARTAMRLQATMIAAGLLTTPQEVDRLFSADPAPGRP